jgi:hypothetical protein
MIYRRGVMESVPQLIPQEFAGVSEIGTAPAEIGSLLLCPAAAGFDGRNPTSSIIY